MKRGRPLWGAGFGGGHSNHSIAMASEPPDVMTNQEPAEVTEESTKKKKSKFQTFKKLFTRKKRKDGSASEEEEAGLKASQSSDDVTDEDQVLARAEKDKDSRSKVSLGSKALSHDSIFVSDSSDPTEALRASQDSIHGKVKSLQLQLKRAVGPGARRAEDAAAEVSEDDGLPCSPAEYSNAQRRGSLSLDGTDSEDDQLSCGASSRAVSPLVVAPGDFSQPASPFSCLDSSASKHKLGLRHKACNKRKPVTRVDIRPESEAEGSPSRSPERPPADHSDDSTAPQQSPLLARQRTCWIPQTRLEEAKENAAVEEERAAQETESHIAPPPSAPAPPQPEEEEEPVGPASCLAGGHVKQEEAEEKADDVPKDGVLPEEPTRPAEQEEEVGVRDTVDRASPTVERPHPEPVPVRDRDAHVDSAVAEADPLDAGGASQRDAGGASQRDAVPMETEREPEELNARCSAAAGVPSSPLLAHSDDVPDPGENILSVEAAAATFEEAQPEEVMACAPTWQRSLPGGDEAGEGDSPIVTVPQPSSPSPPPVASAARVEAVVVSAAGRVSVSEAEVTLSPVSPKTPAVPAPIKPRPSSTSAHDENAVPAEGNPENLFGVRLRRTTAVLPHRGEEESIRSNPEPPAQPIDSKVVASPPVSVKPCLTQPISIKPALPKKPEVQVRPSVTSTEAAKAVSPVEKDTRKSFSPATPVPAQTARPQIPRTQTPPCPITPKPYSPFTSAAPKPPSVPAPFRRGTLPPPTPVPAIQRVTAPPAPLAKAPPPLPPTAAKTPVPQCTAAPAAKSPPSRPAVDPAPAPTPALLPPPTSSKPVAPPRAPGVPGPHPVAAPRAQPAAPGSSPPALPQDEPPWMAMAKKKAKAWSEMPQIVQ
ncbi:hypothetical protein NHX12_011698 [Muraenolepis orangiensis]|uniref:DUF4592 domain-containing protein n=1 Tax=Muraenolepis orangiensis TaxID=630683 RepID=A0A9Q0I7W8_9TELE|nr:hypothetical protein NHX12_011698 [Muraenolepis orangiensis]